LLESSPHSFHEVSEMRLISRSLLACALVGLGYFLGASQGDVHQAARAQGAAAGPGQESTKAITEAQTALQAAKTALAAEGRYNMATKSLNVSAILSGGTDAVADLEAGRGVDPETFAALYADDATDEIVPELSKDEQGRLTYKGKVVRMYSVARLKQFYQERRRFGGDDKK